MIYIPYLLNAISEHLCCKFCHSEVKLVETAVQGLASTFNIECKCCGSKKQFQSSPSISNGVCEINRRSVYAMRSIGKGLSSLQMFCGIMDLPVPVRQSTYSLIQHKILQAAKAVAKDSMKKAVEEEVQLSTNPEKREISISGDGSWKTRGHMSRYGIVSVIGAESGKVIDLKVKSSYCRGCNEWKGPKRGPRYTTWEENHRATCRANHKGSAGSMECKGLLDIFHRSEEKYNVKYVEYIGDGDTSSFKTVHDSMPYGSVVNIMKIECVSHVQKRMGYRLRQLKKKLAGVKLTDGKGIGGIGRLTDVVIDKLQVYYGNAIRENKDNLDNMRRAIWAIWYHEGSIDSDPQHHACPRGAESWCGYCRAEANGTQSEYKHPHPIPRIVMDKIKPIFKDLSTTDLLKRCLKGRTQNANESFNNKVWTICPKTSNSGKTVVKIAGAEAVASFNDGNISKIKILEMLGIKVGKYATSALSQRDVIRVKSSQKRLRESSKEERRIRRRLRLEQHDRNMHKEGTTYAAGAF